MGTSQIYTYFGARKLLHFCEKKVNNIKDFINKVIATYKTGVATEHSYRSAIESLFNNLSNGVTALNEPKRVACGAPDFIVQRGEIVIGHVEAKDLGIGLRKMKDANKNQQQRYRKALPNLIYTNCLDWDFYRNGELIASVTIADFLLGVQTKPEQYETLENLLHDFISQRPQTITNPRVLAEIMACKAQLIKDVLCNALKADKNLKTDLSGQYEAFKEHLIHDITLEDFADIYAETIAYGMFAARLHDTTRDTFSRQEALMLLPKSNPFLRSLFGYIAGVDLDDRIAWIIEDLAAVFQAANVAKIMESFGKLTGQNDPFLHFYETFLAAYNPAKRKARGVWYTPEPVVNFIVRAVDEVLQTDFGLPDGLADTSKISIDWDTGQNNKKGKPISIKKEVNRVQILDPASGTGTFLAEVIKQIAPKVKNVAPGMWSSYIEKDLIPRLHGFELLMASYTMCHMKLEMILTELGYKPTGTPPRLSVYLTNSLEEGEPANQSLPFAQWLSNEVKQANTIKRDMPIMCVIGNPPYNVSSQNMGTWIRSLIQPYKEGLNERKINLDEDYIKFMRFAEHLIEKNGTGIVAMITSNSFLRGVTHRRMREHLLKTFEVIHIFDLHGDSNQKEISPDGSKDENVFDIKQGVSITVMSRRQSKLAGMARVFHNDLFGKRGFKYERLWSDSFENTKWEEIKPSAPYFLFKPSISEGLNAYAKGISLVELFLEYNTGIQTKRDAFCIHDQSQDLQNIQADLISMDTESLRKKYRLAEDNRDWTINGARADLANNSPEIVDISYRPFDRRKTFYTGVSKGFLGYPRHKTMRHMLAGPNISILFGRQNKTGKNDDYFVTDTISEMKCAERTIQSYQAPLYLYPDEQDFDQTRKVNFDEKLYQRLQKLAIHSGHGTPNEVAIFDYIYGVLHCPAYREAYAEFLKMDFPRIPWPPSADEFWEVSAKGAVLRKLHLMEPAAVGKTPYPFMGEGDSVVGKPCFEDGKVWINASQYFENSPDASWGFYIGGYQPAQKWLKDRKGRSLTFEDIKHYQRILKILSETHRVMQEITMTLPA